ncbi:MAG TPA: type II toxin-antitoxin system PemK/MazF family toxin, partial [Acidimicrobiales bacterium]|nr:type II toxin-antitoxin system PemK/MazF family toxin [Acidimicrobiales bacterium]
HRDLPVHVEIEPDAANGLDRLSFVQCELIRSVGRRRLVHRLGSVAADKSFAVHDVIAMILGH